LQMTGLGQKMAKTKGLYPGIKGHGPRTGGKP
jgi:hypothetical protein